MKKCTKCNKEKELELFPKKKSNKDGLSWWCKDCMKEYNKLHPSKKSWTELTNSWAQRNPEKRKQINQDYYKINKTKIDKQSKEWIKNNPLQSKYLSYLNGAKRRKIPFLLTKEEFNSFANKNCHYCSEIVEIIGIDRKDSNQGYTIDNCLACCSICNKMKMETQYDEFLLNIEKIYNNLWKNKNIKK